RRPVSMFVADFIGKAVVLDATEVTRSGPTVTLELLGHRFTFDEPGAGNEPLAAVVRPDDLHLLDADAPAGPDVIVLDGWLRGTEFLGSESRLRIELTDGALVDTVRPHDAAHGPEQLPALGDRVRVGLPRAAVRVVIDRA